MQAKPSSSLWMAVRHPETISNLIAWGAMLSAGTLYLIPYWLPHIKYLDLTPFTGVASLVSVLSVYLRGRRGVLLLVAYMQIGVTLALIFHYGLHWSQPVFVQWVSSNIAGFALASLIGHFVHMQRKVTRINRRLHQTQDELHQQHQALTEAHTHLITVQGELATRNQALSTANQRLEEVHEELQVSNEGLQSANERLTALATTDPLTGLLNHRAMIDRLACELGRAQRFSHHCALLFFDLDHFKALNDGYGHAAGDEVLQQLSRVAQHALRTIDVLSRWGGEEFVAVLTETDEEGALIAAERMRSAIAAHIFPVGGGMHMTCSIGIAIYPQDGTEQGQLLSAADHAMYTAKRLGRNQVRRASETAGMNINIEAASDGSSSRETEALLGTVEALAALVAVREHDTDSQNNIHSRLAYQVALALGLSPHEGHMIEIAGRLYDIGKVAISDAILAKPGTLSPAEWEIIHKHPIVGAEVIQHVPSLRALAPVIRGHHERWDGTGYPDGLACHHIPLGARILAIIDAFTAMTTTRPYCQARSQDEAFDELQRCAGTQFDPQVVSAFVQVLGGPGISEQQAA